MVIISGHLADRRILAAQFQPNWSSLIGALQGVFEALGDAPDPDWLMGVGGHAFRIAFSQADEGLVANETWLAIDHRASLQLYEGMGRAIDLVQTSASDSGFAETKTRTVSSIEKSIDGGAPVVAAGLHTREFGIIRGYNRVSRSFYVSTISQEQTGEAMPIATWPPAPERELTVLLIGNRKKVRRPEAIREALKFACRHAEVGESDTDNRFVHGFKAFDDWAKGLAGGEPLNTAAHAHNIQVVLSARRHAADFLQRHAEETPVAGLLVQAAAAYREEVLAWTRLASLFPYPGVGEIEGAAARLEGSRYLLQALVHERIAIERLREALAVWN
jgi:hypothetical protein